MCSLEAPVCFEGFAALLACSLRGEGLLVPLGYLGQELADALYGGDEGGGLGYVDDFGGSGGREGGGDGGVGDWTFGDGDVWVLRSARCSKVFGEEGWHTIREPWALLWSFLLGLTLWLRGKWLFSFLLIAISLLPQRNWSGFFGALYRGILAGRNGGWCALDSFARSFGGFPVSPLGTIVVCVAHSFLPHSWAARYCNKLPVCSAEVNNVGFGTLTRSELFIDIGYARTKSAAQAI